MGKWHYIKEQKDIDLLMETYRDFHDSCIVSLNYRSGDSTEGSTLFYGLAKDHRLSLIFQSQWEPQTIELEFLGMRQMHLVGWQDNYLDHLEDAYLAFHDKLLPGKPDRVIVWANTEWFDVDKIDNSITEPTDTYIVANLLRWRILDGWTVSNSEMKENYMEE